MEDKEKMSIIPNRLVSWLLGLLYVTDKEAHDFFKEEIIKYNILEEKSNV